MKSSKFRFLLMAGAAAVAMMGTDARALTLKETLEHTYKNNPQLNAERENLKAQDERVRQAISEFLPEADFRYSRFKQTTDITSRAEDERYGDTQSLNLTQPLFSGGSSVARTKSARNQVMAARQGLRAFEQDILLQAVTAYNDVIRDRAVLELNRSNRDVLQKRLDMTGERFRVGELTRTDVAQSEARFASAIASIAQAEASLKSSEATFEKITLMKPDSLDVGDVRLGSNYLPPNTDEIMKIAYENNPSLRAAEYQSLASKSDVYAAAGELLPDVNLTASKSLQDNSSAFVAGSIDEERVGIDIVVPIYRSGTEYSRLRAANKLSERRKQDVLSGRNEVAEDVIQTWEALKAAEATIVATREAVEAAGLAVEGTQMEADFGTRTTLEVLDTQQELFQTRVNLVRAERDATVAYYRLLASAGLLTADKISLGVDVYKPEKNYDKVKFQPIGW